MLKKYLTSIVLGVVVTVWLAFLAFGYLNYQKVCKEAQTVEGETEAFRGELLDEREDLLSQRHFPKDRVVRNVKTFWSEGTKVKSYPAQLLAAPAAGSTRRPPR